MSSRTYGNQRPELDSSMSRDVEFVAAALQMSPLNFVRAAVSASLTELRESVPELDRAMRSRDKYAVNLGAAFAERSKVSA
jgi:hypothetical protein